MSSVRTHCLALEPNSGFPWWYSGKESACQCRRHKRSRSDTWVRKIPWRRKWQPTPVLLPGESYGQRNLEGCSPWTRRVGHDWVCMQCSNTRTQSFPFTPLKFSLFYIYIWVCDPFWVCFCLRCKINRVNGGFLLFFSWLFFFLVYVCSFIERPFFFPLNFFCTFVKH